MPTGADPEVLVDTSVAIALVLRDHEHHDVVFGALHRRRLGLAGHAAFETLSVLTRLPAPSRRTPAAAGRLITANFPHTRFLGSEPAATLLASASTLSLAGGSIYDALVGAAAIEHGLKLCTRDRRAVETYRALGVSYELIGTHAG